MLQRKILFSESGTKEAFKTGQACPLPGAGGIGAAKGAMGSAIVTIIL